ncbi:MAG: protein kinase [Phycisphaerales bacterium]|nr:protein kinase [Phycisphaerales bacterium]MCB9837551.1 protein kinase [Phycisphaera sp.]
MGHDDTASIDTHGPDDHRRAVSRSMGDPVTTGDMLGVYKLLERIGEGGFGAVYLAEQTEPVRRRVAVKLLKFGQEAEHILARFNAERQTLAMMDHPNIAKILDAGQSDRGVSYFVMEYVQGSPITDYCDGARLSIRERINLIRGVCHAVTHAHQKGIIHRDIKPSNVLVTLSNDKPLPKVIDFGIAKVVATTGSDDSAAYTRIHQMLGTPAYMSPEQAGGAAHAIDTRSDVYSIGAMLYELLVGATPLDGKLINELPILELHNKIATEQAPPLTTRLEQVEHRAEQIALCRSTSISNLRTTVKGDLNWIVQKCLEKDPLRRYPTVSALEDDLRRYLANEPVVAGPPSQLYLFKKFLRRRRVEVAAAVTVLIVLVLGFLGTVIGWARATEESKRLQFTIDFFSQSLADASESSSPIAIWSETPSLTLGEALAQSQILIENTFDNQPELEATIRQLIGLAQLRGGKYDDAQLQLARSLELRKQKLGSDDPKVLELLLPIAEAKSKAGDVPGAMSAATSAYERHAEVYGADSEITRSVALWIARWLNSGFRFSDAESYFEKAMLTVGGTPDTDDPITLAAMIERVSVSVSEGELARAESHLRSAEPRISQLPESDTKLRTLFTRQFGMLLVLRGKTDEAIRYLTPPPGIEPQNEDRVQTRLLAWAQGRAGNYDVANAMFAQILDIESRNPGTIFREIFARLFYADILLQQGNARDAATQADLAIEKYDANELPNDPDRLWGKALASMAHTELGESEAAESCLDDALRIQQLFPEHRLHVPTVLLAKAKYEHAQGDNTSATATVREAIKLAIEIYGPDHPITKSMQSWRDSL